jgi:hypothetical protein
MTRFAALPVGTTIAAAVDFGPVIKGQWGIVTGHRMGVGLKWWKPLYQCSFLGGIKVTASRSQLAAVQHGHSRRVLEDPFWFLNSRGLASCALRHEVEVRQCMTRTH